MVDKAEQNPKAKAKPKVKKQDKPKGAWFQDCETDEKYYVEFKK